MSFELKRQILFGTVWTNATAFTTNSQTQPPAISAELASSVLGTTATANGNLLAKDGGTAVDIYYGKADLSDIATGWTSSNLAEILIQEFPLLTLTRSLLTQEAQQK